jgi:hypothetical protein
VGATEADLTPHGPSLACRRADFTSGTLDGVVHVVGETALTLAHESGPGTWTGPWLRPGFPVVEVIPSWSAVTPPGSYLQIALQGQTHVGFETAWYAVACWAQDDGAIRRTSVAGPADELGRIETDVLRASTGFDAYRLRLTLHPGHGGAPVVRAAATLAASAGEAWLAPSAPLRAEAVELAVPAYSQSVHAGEYPELDNGGASWCSPTSTAMIVAFWGTGPSAGDYAWVDPAVADPWVDHAARHTYDAAYGGCGNWPFNTAYAAGFGLDAFVTRLRSLREAELLLRAGIPLAASIVAGPGELDGYAHPHGTAGHLVVLAGLTTEGDPIVNDPAAATNDDVRRVYPRAQFERAWLDGSGGVVYVIRRPDVPLPPSGGNW